MTKHNCFTRNSAEPRQAKAIETTETINALEGVRLISVNPEVEGERDEWRRVTELRQYKKQANEIRTGNIIDLNGRLLQVTKFQHTQGSGRQLGNVQLELRDLKLGSKHLERKRPYDMVEVARLEAKPFQFLYTDGSQLHLMDPQTFEQEAVDGSLFGEQAVYLKEGCVVSLNFHNGRPVSGELPQIMTMSVQQAEPYAKGDSSSATYKAAVLETGAKMMVPAHIVQGEQIVIDTTLHTFVRRAK
ncbi:hypothetical protein WJX72_001490 [[Myrmecia] bisecta]|uniref:Elongation factor P n=1 Tax=[Myrmecia] bisecta TaxID=41462 RepID=A0AAW1PS74_9CHLO